MVGKVMSELVQPATIIGARRLYDGGLVEVNVACPYCYQIHKHLIRCDRLPRYAKHAVFQRAECRQGSYRLTAAPWVEIDECDLGRFFTTRVVALDRARRLEPCGWIPSTGISRLARSDLHESRLEAGR